MIHKKIIHQITSNIKNKKIILFGELHGTKEIPEMLSNFFLELAEKETFNLCLEIPDEFQNKIDSYMENGNENILKSISFFSKKYCTDGRNSLEYVNLLGGIRRINVTRNKKIKIFCVSLTETRNQEEAEKGIANNIMKSINNKKTFAIMGSIHASKRAIEINNQKIIPAGLLIYKMFKEKEIGVFNLGNGLIAVKLDSITGDSIEISMVSLDLQEIPESSGGRGIDYSPYVSSALGEGERAESSSQKIGASVEGLKALFKDSSPIAIFVVVGLIVLLILALIGYYIKRLNE